MGEKSESARLTETFPSEAGLRRKKTKTMKLTHLMLFPALTAGISLAQETKPGPADAPRDGAGLFARFDKNGDGKLTKDEVPREELFNRLDTNADGAVTQDEARAGMEKLQKLRVDGARPAGGGSGAGTGGGNGDMFKDLDKNGDGKLTKDEVPREELFKRLDADADGTVTPEEAREAREKLGDRPGRPGAEGPGPAGAAGDWEERFKKGDKNGDGKLSREEMPREEMFKRLDADADGFVTKDEARKAAGSREGEPPQPPRGERAPAGPGREAGPGPMPGGGPAGMEFRPRMSEDQFIEFMKRIDLNHDGSVTMDEAHEAYKIGSAMQDGFAPRPGQPGVGPRPEGGPRPGGGQRPEGGPRPGGQRPPVEK